MNGALLSANDALAQLPVSRRTLTALVSARKIGHLRLGHRLYFRQGDLDEFLQRQHVAAVPGTAP